MMNRVSLKIRYKANGNSLGLSELVESLNEEYLVQVRPDGRPQSGGIVDSLIEVFVDIPLEEYLRFIRDGVAWDLITRGKNSFVLRPIVRAFQKLEALNTSWDYSTVKFMFDDTEVVIYGSSDLFTSKVGSVVNHLAKHYHKLLDPELGTPYQILVPISRSINEPDGSEFANYGGGTDFEPDDYLTYWGVVYNLGYKQRIFDVANQALLDKTWKF